MVKVVARGVFQFGVDRNNLRLVNPSNAKRYPPEVHWKVTVSPNRNGSSSSPIIFQGRAVILRGCICFFVKSSWWHWKNVVVFFRWCWITNCFFQVAFLSYMETWNRQNWKEIPFLSMLNFQGVPPKKINMYPKKGTISKGSFIFQPLIFRGKLLVFQGVINLLKSFWHASIAHSYLFLHFGQLLVEWTKLISDTKVLSYPETVEHTCRIVWHVTFHHLLWYSTQNPHKMKNYHLEPKNHPKNWNPENHLNHPPPRFFWVP